MSAPVPGFYVDPHIPDTLRWWDGTQWTEQTQPMDRAHPARPPLGGGWATLAVAVQALLVMCAAAAVFVALTNLYIVDVYGRIAEDPTSVSQPEAETADQLVLWQFVEAPLVLVCGILFITWLYRGHRSDRMEPRALKHRSGWAIGGWFVPFLNLWRPYQMVTDLRRGATGTSEPLTYPVQVAWWAAFVAWTILDRIVFALVTDADEIPAEDFALYAEQYQTVAAWDVARCVASVVAATLAVVMVRRLTSQVLQADHGRR